MNDQKKITREQFYEQIRRDKDLIIEAAIKGFDNDPNAPADFVHGQCVRFHMHVHVDAARVCSEVTAAETTIRCEGRSDCPAVIEFAPGSSVSSIAAHLTRRRWHTIKQPGGASVVLCPRCSPAPSPSSS